MRDYSIHELLVVYPLVREDAPEWKKICPFCGEYDCIHEAGDTYICHWCNANWIEHDTETERQIQILHLNHGKMPLWGVGEMPLVGRVFLKGNDFERIEVNFRDGKARYCDCEHNVVASAELTDEFVTGLFAREAKHYVECA